MNKEEKEKLYEEFEEKLCKNIGSGILFCMGIYYIGSWLIPSLFR